MIKRWWDGGGGARRAGNLSRSLSFSSSIAKQFIIAKPGRHSWISIGNIKKIGVLAHVCRGVQRSLRIAKWSKTKVGPGDNQGDNQDNLRDSCLFWLQASLASGELSKWPAITTVILMMTRSFSHSVKAWVHSAFGNVLFCVKSGPIAVWPFENKEKVGQMWMKL